VPETRPPAHEFVRATIAAASRRRRIRDNSRQAWRLAPVVAAAGLAVAAAGRWAGWPVIVPLGVLALGFAGLAAHAYAIRRERVVSDALAARIDADAGLGGELRSASWFAGRENRDIWADFHLDRAAERLRGRDWTQLYPAVRAPRAQIATLVLVVAALALSITIPGRAVRLDPAPETPESDATRRSLRVEDLPPELQKQLADLLAAAETGTTAGDGRLAASAELRELLDRLSQLHDSAVLKDLARAMEAARDGRPDQPAKELMTLAERTRRAAEMGAMSPELRDALENLAENLAEAAKAEQAANEEAGDAAGFAKTEAADAAQADANMAAAIQSVKETDADAAAGVIMMSDENSPGGGDPGVGAGGGSAAEKGAGTMPDIERALRQETVEASTDSPGENVLTETRRKTEQGRAALTYTHGTSGSFDRSHAAAPPPVPEGRRSAVHTYFIRKQ
jgi:hypothetical protein